MGKQVSHIRKFPIVMHKLGAIALLFSLAVFFYCVN